MSTPALIKRYTKLVTKLKAWSPSSPTDPLIPSHSALLSSSSSLPDPSAVADADVPVIEDFLKRVEGFSREVQIAQGLGKADAPENRKGGGGGGGGKEKAEKKEGGGVGGGGVKEGVGEGKEKKAAAAPKKAKEKAVKEERKEEEAKEAQESKSLDAVQTVDTPLPAYIAHRVQVWDRIAARKDTTSSTPSTPPRAITITLPDGKQLPGTAGVTTPYDVAKQLTTNTERFVLAKVNDVQWDLHRPLEADAALVLCDFDSHEGSHTFWHSSAHLLGQAVEKEYHDVRLCVGPPLDDGGFYYDVEMGEQKVSPVDFPRLEKVVEKISRERQPFTRMELSKEEALEMFSFNPFKQEIIRSKVPDGANCTAYRCGPLIDLCIAAGTKINLANGNSVAIENVRPGDSVLSLTADGGLEPRVVAACSQPREKECVELLFADGRTLVCTADHRIRSADGRWVPAGELQLGDAVAVGIEYPSHDQLASSTSTWQMSLPGFAAFTASTWARTAAVSRMLGYSMSDGTFPDGDNSHYCGAVYLGHQFDVATFAADFLTLFGRVAPNAVPIHNTLSVQLPKVFADGLLHLGINKGNRVAVVSHFPAAFLAADCPLPVVQEFLGGLFGGDGHTFAYTHSCGVFDGLGWSCTKKGSVVREQVEVLHAELLMLLVRCGLPTDALSIIVSKPPPCQLTAAGAADTARRKDAGEKLSDQIELTDTTQLDSDMSYKIRLRIGSDAAVAFAERVGFRYCVHKQMRLTAAACWYRGRNVEMQQRSRLRALAKLPTSRTPATRLSSASLAAFAAVKLQLGKQELLHPGVASWCPSRQCHVHQSPREPAVPVQTAMTDWQLEQFFSARRVGEKYVAEAVGDVGEGAVKKQKMVNNKVTYGVHRSRASLPLFRVQLIAKRDVGKRVVYDLAVPSGDDDLDSFTAAGIVVHNCKGPHVPHSGYIKALQVTKASSAYWLAKAENPSLQRVYGISFPSKQRLKEWDALMKQAEERDHRRVGVQQRLFFFHEWSPGSCFFLPHGARLYNRLVGYIRDEYVKRGYTEVISPNVYNVELWKTSGHYQNYKENMFLFECEGQEFALKPMSTPRTHHSAHHRTAPHVHAAHPATQQSSLSSVSPLLPPRCADCPGHCLMFGVHLHSYRDLPVRFADFGVLHRNEISGALTGLTRVRRFQQDDAHICTLAPSPHPHAPLHPPPWSSLSFRCPSVCSV